MKTQLPVITTVYNGKNTEWITVIEEGRPVWVPLENSQKPKLAERISDLFQKALNENNDEPVIKLVCEAETFELCYFPEASLYLCEDLEGRYSTIASLTDALWNRMGEQKILSATLL